MDELQKLPPDRSCAVICDLLPLYAEDMLSPASKQAVIDHLAACEDCRAAYARMNNEALALRQTENQQAARPLRRFRWHVLFNILGAPIWIPLLIAAAAVVLAIYICIWAVVISLWCAPIALGASVLACLASGGLALVQGQVAAALLLLAVGMICAGLAILLAFPCCWLCVAIGKLTALVCRRLAGRRKKEAV